MMEQYEKDKEIERLNKDVSRLEELLSVSETQYASVEQIVERLQEQLKEANEVIKKYSDGSIYLFPTWYNGSFEANKYLEKWGVK